MLGPSTAGLIVLEAAIGWLVVEWAMADWRRVPFTCPYMPGKEFVPLAFAKAFLSYVVFWTVTTILLRISFARPRVGLAFALVIGAELPTDVNPLRLNAD